ncbi:MAG: hypothetical protein R3D67_14795 [Hyphomicrobiaceae bacterium]
MKQPMRWLARCLALLPFWWSVDLACAGDVRVPAGRDPGGIAVGIVGSGIDYTKPELAARLARDGEGEAIGWDFVDNDRRPLARGGIDDAVSLVIIEEARAVRLVVVRAVPDNPPMLAPALQFVAQTPARITLFLAQLKAPIPRAHIDEAARRLPGLVLIVPRRLVGDDRPAGADGALVVGAMTPDGAGGAGADLMVRIDVAAASGRAGPRPAGLNGDDLAAARIAALAARLQAAEPGLDRGGLKRRLLSFARAQPRGAVIEDIRAILPAR